MHQRARCIGINIEETGEMLMTETDNKIIDYATLQYALNTGIIDISHVQEQAKMKKRQEILNQHNHEIWIGKDGKCYTYVDDEKKGRLLKKRKNKESMEEYLIGLYSEQNKPMTVQDVFNESIKKKIEYEEIGFGSKERYEIDFRRYLTEIAQMSISEVGEYQIEDLVKRTVVALQLNTKSFSNMRTIYYLIFKYAKKMGVTNVNITEVFSGISLPKKLLSKKHLDPGKQVYSNTEREEVIKYLTENLDLINMGLLLMFKTGIRVGELAALKRGDIGENYITISRTETRYRKDGEYVYDVKESPKTEAGERKIYLPDNSLWILKKLRSYAYIGEYLFEKEGERIKTFTFRKRLSNVCEKCGVDSKSPHKVRKTYGTMLINSHVDERLVIRQMGHSNIGVTKGSYYYDDKNSEQKRQQINSVSGL